MYQWSNFFGHFLRSFHEAEEKGQNDNNPEINKAQCIFVLVFLTIIQRQYYFRGHFSAESENHN